MKIKVTFEKVFDSLDFFDPEFHCTERELKNEIFEDIKENSDLSDDEWTTEIIE